ncbi:MAG TPA: transaldolase [Candidatus Binatia bacterium]|jgi:transaldolase/glucose-6-phosphate isomerase
MSNQRNPLFRLKDFGVSVWCDELSRDMIRGGTLKRLIEEKAVVGVTSNPSIFQKALSEGDAYDADFQRMVAKGLSNEEIFDAFAVEDIREACDVLRPVYAATGGHDGYVSIEVNPLLASDTAATISEAERYHREIDRPNLMVKIPATPEGIPAIRRMISIGKSINITLIFSVERYAQVAEAYLSGLREFVDAGGDPATVASVASFFVSRIDTEADHRIDAALAREKEPARRRRLQSLKGAIAVANAKLAFSKFHELFSGPRWETLALRGAREQRCLWASTSTKNKAYSDILYVQQLIGGPTVNTMPPATMDAYLDHGHPEETLTHGIEQAQMDIAALAEFGIDFSDITDNFSMTDGVQKFVDAYRKLLDGLEAKRGSRRSAAAGG